MKNYRDLILLYFKVLVGGQNDSTEHLCACGCEVPLGSQIVTLLNLTFVLLFC